MRTAERIEELKVEVRILETRRTKLGDKMQTMKSGRKKSAMLAEYLELPNKIQAVRSELDQLRNHS